MCHNSFVNNFGKQVIYENLGTEKKEHEIRTYNYSERLSLIPGVNIKNVKIKFNCCI